MKKLLAMLLLLGSNAYAISSYVGTENQDVTVTNIATTTISGTVNSSIVNIATVTVSGTASVSVINPVLVTSSNTIIKDSAGDALAINTDGSINTIVTSSTQAIKGRNGNTITSQNISASTEPLHVLNLGQPNLYGRSIVYKSSDSMVTSGILTLDAMIKSIDLISFNDDCTFNINSGSNFQIKKNTAEDYNFDYVMTGGTVTLVSKGAAATCKVRIFGAN